MSIPQPPNVPQQPGYQAPYQPPQSTAPGYQPPPPPPETYYVKRPWNITLVAIITLLIGLLDVFAGLGMLLFRNERQYQDYLGLNASNMAIFGAVVLVVGAIVLLVSFGLFGGSRLARGVIAFLAVVRIALAVVGITLSATTSVWGGFAGEILLSIIVLFMLYAGRRTRLFFAQ